MQRRDFITNAIATAVVVASPPAVLAQTRTGQAKRTRWLVRTSEGLDAIAFLGALSGGQLYLEHYAEEAAVFARELPPQFTKDLAALWAKATADGFGLLGPNLAVLFSTDGNDATLNTLLTGLRERDQLILPKYRKSEYWSEKDWAWFSAHATRLEAIFVAMRDADFASFRVQRTLGLTARVAEVQRALNSFDVIFWQEKLTGRTFEPTIEIVLLRFSKPHGIKVQGQTFLQAADYDTATTIRIAAHEMLHPPVRMDGAAAKAALAVLARDPLMTKIVREHDPKWGYTTLEGVLNEDLVQALDQLISEALGVARNPADRWRKSDDGFHVLAGALYGLLRQDRWIETGGSIEKWLFDAARTGRLAPAVLHFAAARVLERPVGRLWPL